MRTGVVMCVFNRVEVVGASVDSILADVPPETPVAIIDDVSTDGARSLVSKYEGRCRVILNERNIGLCASANKGFDFVKMSGCRDAIRINSDICVKPGWFKAITSVAQNQGVGVVGACIPNIYGTEVWGAHAIDAARGSPAFSESRWVIGHCMLLTHRLLDRGFRWEERIYPVGPCDLDVCAASITMGLKNVIAQGAHCELMPCRPSLSYSEHDGCNGGIIKEKWPKLFDDFLRYSPVSVSVIIPTIPRPSVKLAIMSTLKFGAHRADEIVVCSDGPSDFVRSLCSMFSGIMPVRYMFTEKRTHDGGNSQRDLAMERSSGTHLAFIDDDDAYIPDTLIPMRRAIGKSIGKVSMFRARHPRRGVVWKSRQISSDNVSAQCIVVPNRRGLLGRWANGSGGAFGFLSDTLRKRGERPSDVVWHDQIIVNKSYWGRS